VEELRRRISLNLSDSDARFRLGIFLRHEGEIEAATREIEEAVKLRPIFPEAHYALGLIRLRKKDLDGAIIELRKTISQKPNYAEAHNTLGLLLRENGKREDQWDRQEPFRSD
jgi:Flp pilus assembly protein TadD